MEEIHMSRANPRFRRSNPNLPLVGTTNGVVQYVVQGQVENQMTINTFMYSAPVPAPTPTQLQTLLTNLSGTVFVRYKGLVSADWTCVRELLKVVHRNDIATVISTGNNGVVGGRPAGHEPTEVAGVILRQTAIKGQHGRGRYSFPAVSTADVVNSTWTSVGLTAALALWYVAALGNQSDGTNTWTPCVGQRGVASPRLIVGFAPVVSFQGTNLLGTIRRRKIGRGK
jgi:hypothetical protein